MSDPRSEEVRYTFAKVNVNYEPKSHERRRSHFGLQSSKAPVESESPRSTSLAPPPQSSWFERLDITKNHMVDPAPSHVIDVQPDFRYPLAYITYSIKELYDNSVHNQIEAEVTLFTLIYYCQSLVVATLLFYDLYSRPQKSCHAASFRQDTERGELSDLLFESRVPNFMAQLLSHLSPAFDAHQPNLLYVPTLAGFSFRHDFGRLVPPGLFLAANSVMCEKRREADPMENLRSFHATKIVSIAGVDYYVTNFLGGPYLDGDEVCDRPNWIRQDIDYFVSAGISGDFENNCQYFPLNYRHEWEINPYDLMLCYDDANRMGLLAVLKSVSRFFLEREPSSVTLGSLLSSPSGITIMSHFYASPTLQTCHSLPPPPVIYGKEHSFIDDAQFAGKTRFLSTQSDETETTRVRFSPLSLERFDRFTNVRGDIFGFQPYGQDVVSLGVALTLGLTIENGDIDGVTLSQPNLRLSLRDNNSLLLQGSLPVRVVRAYIPDFKPASKLILFKRADRSSFPNNPVGFARGDMGQVILLNAEHVASTTFDVNNSFYTYMAWNRSDERLPIPDSSVYFWSSYRYVDYSHDYESPDVYFYYTLKALYGNIVNMTKLKCPSWLFPV